ncbi:NADH-cytochrome b5 reductase-like isoform X2 [Parus major]|uniref:NADH-cytochrome b5 reductase-like isoform X2 n=1 Tax=Parus major TaxID=9157 RepID=UPI00144443DA|nr:NADH-cytochrome b5 reductase-like isoform X2 [Parus major]
MSDNEQDWLALRPQEPSPSQCCGSGCKPCIYDVYEKELAQWERAKAMQDKSLLLGKKEQCYEAGLMSKYIKTWKRGDVVFWRGPFGGFPYQPNKHGELLMLASGTGLAPMIPILQSITDDEEDETFVTLVGCFPTFDKIYLKPLLQDLARYWNIRIFYVLSQETSLEKLPWSYQENTYTGRLSEDLMKTIVNSCRRRPFVLICGSSAFNEDMSRYLKAAGVEENSYFVF